MQNINLRVYQAKFRNISQKKSLMGYIFNCATIYYSEYYREFLVNFLNSIFLMNLIFDKIGTYLRENSGERNLLEC